ncbi:MAG: 6-hydroxymethylpterin diphosphokinase MptE-like protein [candidate division NC10 bacterium]|jgi:hypothetical protein
MKDFVVRGLSDSDFRKLQKRKEDDGFGERSWKEWLEHLVVDVALEESLSDRFHRATREKLSDLWLANFARNLPLIMGPDARALGDLLLDLQVPGAPPAGPAIVIGGGPSLREHRHLEMLAESCPPGLMLIATDRILIPLLRLGVIPDLVVSIDGDHEVIARFVDDPVVDQHGSKLRVAMASMGAPPVVERLVRAGATIYWFHPLFDDPRRQGSLTALQRGMTRSARWPQGLPAVSCGGHAGATGWVLAHALLKRSPIGLIGLNLGYPVDEPLEKTQCYPVISELTSGDPEAARAYFTEIYNPDLGQPALLDVMFAEFRRHFLEMLERVPPWVRTCNCTQGGSLFGPGITTLPLARFLEHVASKETSA